MNKTKLSILVISIIAVIAIIWITISICSAKKGNQEIKDHPSYEVKAAGVDEDYPKMRKLKLEYFGKKKPMLLSDFVEDLKMVRLDSSNPDVFLGQTSRLYFSKNYIAVFQSKKPLLLFCKKTGKFLTEIGKVGRGPGEYTMGIGDVIIDEANDRIYLNKFASSILLEYTLDNKFIKSINPLRKETGAKTKLFLKDSVFTAFILPMENDDFMSYKFNLNGDTISFIKNYVDNSIVYDDEIFVNHYGDHISYINLNQYTNSSIYYHYDITHECFYPIFAYDKKEMKEKKLHFFVHETSTDYLINIYYFIEWVATETPGAYSAELLAEERFLIMDKNFLNRKSVKIVDDYLFDIPVDLLSQNGVYYRKFSAIDLKEKLQEAIKNNNLSPKRKKEAIALNESISENDNDIIFYGKFK